MSQEDVSQKDKDAQYKWAITMFLVYCVWVVAYLYYVRPMLNQFLWDHGISSYPMLVHLVFMIGPFVLLGFALGLVLPKKPRS